MKNGLWERVVDIPHLRGSSAPVLRRDETTLAVDASYGSVFTLYAPDLYGNIGESEVLFEIHRGEIPLPKPISIDNVPPVVTVLTPSGTLSGGTTEVGAIVSTNENASCKVRAVQTVPSATKSASFNSADGLVHTAILAGLIDGEQYQYAVNCVDDAGNSDVSNAVIQFVVDVDLPPEPSLPLGWNDY